MDPTQIPALETALRDTRWEGLHVHEVVGSTQDAAMAGPPGSRIHWAKRQTAGRGRQGRHWSDGGQDLAVTFRLEGWQASRPELLAIAVPVAVALAAEAWAPERLWCKWPNDVLATAPGAASPGLGLAKLAGVLIDGSGSVGHRAGEAHGGRTPIWRIGIGLNVNRRAFPADLDQPATSLAHLTGRDLDRGELLVRLARDLDRLLTIATQPDPETLMAAYRERLHGMGRVVQVESGQGIRHTGRLTGLTVDGLEIEGHPTVPLAHVSRIAV